MDDSGKARSFGVDDPDHYWREREHAGRTKKKRVHHFIRALVDQSVSGTGDVLICGVGDGHEYQLCSENHNTWGVEYSSYAISQYDFPTERIACADLNDGIPDFGVKFDAITISMVLHWLDDPKQFLIGLKTHLKPGGTAVVIIPNITYYRYRLGFLLGKFPPISLSHKNFQTPTESEAMFLDAGFTITKRAASKKALKAKLWPKFFATDIGYILSPSGN
jgi:SAM-dependent methyltransferase